MASERNRHIIIAAALLATSGACAHPQHVVPPAITLSVEQPAYTGMPTWLHLTVRDECLEEPGPSFPLNEYLWMRDDGPEVTLEGKPVARTPFTDVDLEHRVRLPGSRPCQRALPMGPEHDHRFVLSGAYIFDQPGHYKVRWLTADNFDRRVPVATSDWFDFSVEASTPYQRKVWLDSMLPRFLLPDIEPQSNIDSDYIPTHLVAWRDPG
jgi:hypothetical protein